MAMVSGENFLERLHLADGRVERWDRDLEDVLFRLQAGQFVGSYLREDIVHLLEDFGDLLARLDDLRYVELEADDDDGADEDGDDEKDPETKIESGRNLPGQVDPAAATSPSTPEKDHE
jgi:hypothetical protein